MRQNKPRNRTPLSQPEADPPALDSRSQRRIEAFTAAVRPRIELLIRRSVPLNDLAESFPALLYALATGYGSDAARHHTIAAVEDGLPLKEAAARLGVPLWLRKLPAGALQTPLVALPTDPALTSRLVSLIPTQPSVAAAWLERVLLAHHTCSGSDRTDLTLWVAQQFRSAKPIANGSAFLGVLSWAWFSSRTPSRSLDDKAAALLTTRWAPNLGAARATKEAALWRERIALCVCLGAGLKDTWIPEGSAGGLDFVALRNARDFIVEAQRMDNCLDRYADRLYGRAVRIFSIRRDGRSIADMEITTHEREPGHPVIAQLRGPHNRRAALEVWRAAYQWLGSQPLRLADRGMAIRIGPAVRRRRQDEIWRPFIDALPERTAVAFETTILARKRKKIAPVSSPLPSRRSSKTAAA